MLSVNTERFCSSTPWLLSLAEPSWLLSHAWQSSSPSRVELSGLEPGCQDRARVYRDMTTTWSQDVKGPRCQGGEVPRDDCYCGPRTSLFLFFVVNWCISGGQLSGAGRPNSVQHVKSGYKTMTVLNSVCP